MWGGITMTYLSDFFDERSRVLLGSGNVMFDTRKFEKQGFDCPAHRSILGGITLPR